jgi:hypothetical protein
LSNNKSGSAENAGKQAVSNKEQVAPVISSKVEDVKNNEISALRTDVEDLSSEVQTAVGDLKKSIADIRSSVSEIENPFNLLREVSNEKEIENLKGEGLPVGVKSLILEKQEKNETQEEKLEPKPVEPPKEAVIKERTNRMLIPLPQNSAKASPYIDWIWDLLDAGLTPENIRQLACSCELMNYLPHQASILIYSLALTAEKMRSVGFTKGHLLLFLYKAAAMSKTNLDPEDMEALINITEQQLDKSDKNRGM